MKHGRVRAALFVGVLSTVAVFVMNLVMANSVMAADVPFTEHVISTTAMKVDERFKKGGSNDATTLFRLSRVKIERIPSGHPCSMVIYSKLI